MVGIPDYKTIADLIKKGMTLEAQEQIMALREAAVELKADNTELKAQLAELKKKADIQDKLVWEPPYFFLMKGKKKEGPYCQHCWEHDQKLLHLQIWCKGKWKCMSCRNQFTDNDYVAPKAIVRTPRSSGLISY